MIELSEQAYLLTKLSGKNEALTCLSTDHRKLLYWTNTHSNCLHDSEEK